MGAEERRRRVTITRDSDGAIRCSHCGGIVDGGDTGEFARLALDDRLALTVEETAKVLGLSDRTVRAWLPRIPHVRFGRAPRIPVDALRRWLDERARRDANRVDEIVREGLRAVRPTEK